MLGKDCTVCLIDAQRAFAATNNKRFIRETKNLLMRAMVAGAAIMLVQYEKHGNTLPELYDLVRQYDRHRIIEKASDDGGTEIIDGLFFNDFPSRKILIAGVDLQFCVRSTTETLSKLLKNSKIYICKQACNSIRNNKTPWIDELPNVYIINELEGAHCATG